MFRVLAALHFHWLMPFTVLLFLMPKLYSNSVLSSLNARRAQRLLADATVELGHRSVEVGAFSTIQSSAGDPIAKRPEVNKTSKFMFFLLPLTLPAGIYRDDRLRQYGDEEILSISFHLNYLPIYIRSLCVQFSRATSSGPCNITWLVTIPSLYLRYSLGGFIRLTFHLYSPIYI